MKVQKSRKQEAGSVERIRKAVLAKYDGQKDICIANAIKRWQEERWEGAENEPFGELFHKISSPEMEKLAVEWHVADIEENIAIEKVKQTEVRLGEARARFISGLAIHEGVYANSDDMSVMIAAMEVWKVNKEALRKSLPRKVVEFSRAAASDELDIGEVRHGKLPSKFKELRLIDDYIKDLLAYFEEHGDAGKAQIRKLCEDRDYAERLLADKATAQPVKFLADQVLATKTVQNSLREQAHPIGFAVAHA